MGFLQKIRDTFYIPEEGNYLPLPDSIEEFYEKSSLFSPVASAVYGNTLTPSNADYSALSTEGYAKNPYVYACIDMLASSGANLKLTLFKGRREIIREARALDLLGNVMYGNTKLSYYDFMYYIWTYLYLAGNAYLFVDMSTGVPNQLYLLNPNEIRIEVRGSGSNQYAVYFINNKEYKPQNNKLIHMKFFNPLQKVEGMPPLTAVAYSIDQNNSGRVWNTNLMQRMTKIDGYLESNAGRMSEKQRSVLKEEINTRHGGPNNVMKTMVLPGGMKFHPLTMSAADMDWEKVMHTSGSEVAMALKVPAELLGLANNTYGNVKEAKAGLYSEAVIPQMNRILYFINNELLSLFNQNLELRIDMDKVDVLKRDRTLITKQAVSLFDSGIITKNEARRLLGYDDISEGDVFKDNPKGPDFRNPAREAELEKEPNQKVWAVGFGSEENS